MDSKMNVNLNMQLMTHLALKSAALLRVGFGDVLSMIKKDFMRSAYFTSQLLITV